MTDEVKQDLHAQIMNLRANARHIDDVACKRAYMEGHRDARHAAAELVAAPPSKAEEGEPVAYIDAHKFKALRSGPDRGGVLTTLTSHRAFPEDVALYASPLHQEVGELSGETPADFEAERERFEAIYPRPAHCDWIAQSARFCTTSYNGWDAVEHCNKWLGWKARAIEQHLRGEKEADALPFDAEYVAAYLGEIVREATGNADPEVQRMLAWLSSLPQPSTEESK